MTGGNYSNTILGAIIAVLGLGLVGLVILPENLGATVFFGFVVVVVTQLLSMRQTDANGHRLTRVETVVERRLAADTTPTTADHLRQTDAPPETPPEPQS